MTKRASLHQERFAVVKAPGKQALFSIGAMVRVDDRAPVGHYRVPLYLRGKMGRVMAVIEPPGIDNEEDETPDAAVTITGLDSQWHIYGPNTKEDRKTH